MRSDLLQLWYVVSGRTATLQGIEQDNQGTTRVETGGELDVEQ